MTTNTAIVRVEQLYPFPTAALARRIKRMTALEQVVWCQEEPKNNGAWFFVEPYIEEALDQAGKAPMRARYAGRKAARRPRPASPSATRPSRRRWSPTPWVSPFAKKFAAARKGLKHGDRSQSARAGRIDHRGDARQWLKQPGDAVAHDEPIASLETDKVAVEVPAPVAGVMGEQLVKEGDTVTVGAVIATIEAGERGRRACEAGARPAARRRPAERPPGRPSGMTMAVRSFVAVGAPRGARTWRRSRRRSRAPARTAA